MNWLKKIKLDDKTNKLNKIDWIIIGIIVLLYGILSFIRLGDTSAPSTYRLFTYEDEEEVITLQGKTTIGRMRYYTGNRLGAFKILVSNDGINYEDVTDLEIESVFVWKDINIFRDAKYIKIVCKRGDSSLGDLVFYGDNNRIIPMVIDADSPLTDEIDLVPEELSFMNSTYFDEIYYARTVYEYNNGLSGYEWTHPPLGKLIMMIPVTIFGFSPFTYRLMGNIFGILMIPLMYILAKKIFKNRKWAILAGLIMTFDCFHFAHTRIALIDGFQVVFILLSVLFMKMYMDLSHDDFKKKTIYLVLSGLFIGCAIATKWNALYAGLGLAITFFVHLFSEYHVNVLKYLKEKLTINRIIKWLTIIVLIPYVLYYLSIIIFNIKAGTIILIIYFFVLACSLFVIFYNFILNDKYLNKLLLVCVVSFIAIPIIVYISSYVLSPKLDYYDGTVKGIIDVSKSMYDYHANLISSHPFSSSWYTWPIMYKPVWLYSGGTSTGLSMTISDIGNPAIWWCGVLAFIYLAITAIKKKDKTSIFILIFILSTYIPYIFVGRLMFMYHFFITIPFVMLGIVSLIKWICEKTKSNKVYYGYIALIILTFIFFYPIVSGMPVEKDYIESLKWFSSWYF